MSRSRAAPGSAVRRLIAAGIVTAASWHASPAPGQGREVEPCPAGRVVEILVDNQSVFDTAGVNGRGRFAWAYDLANTLHVQTERQVVERELLFEVGDCYDVELLRDSERLLRAFPFIADANVYAVQMEDGDYRVFVDTQDEWSTRVEPRVGSNRSNGSIGLRGIRVVEDNLMGTGRHFSLYYDREEGDRVYGLAYATPHLFRTRWNMGIQVAKTQVGHSLRESVTYPFVGEVGRFAFRHTLERQDRYFELLMPQGGPELSRVWVPVRREQVEVGAAVRWGGQRYRHTMLGSALAVEKIGYPGDAHFADEEITPRIMADVQPGLRFHPISSVRLMMLTGQRNVQFVRRRALDTVNGTEDVQLGVEAEGSFGPTLPVVSHDRDVALGLGLFAAGDVTDRLLAGGTFSFEARRAYESLPGLPEWNDVFGELDLWAYYRRSAESPHLFVASVSALGGWHGRVPFQLTLGGDAGLRGYPRHVDPGGRRVVASLEHRASLGWPTPELFDLGSVAFVDVGKIWAGHVPFGTNSPIRASAGVGIRAAFPPGSRQTFRLDLGMPIDRGIGWNSLTVTMGVGQAIGRSSARRDPQIMRSTRYGLGANSFLHGGAIR